MHLMTKVRGYRQCLPQPLSPSCPPPQPLPLAWGRGALGAQGSCFAIHCIMCARPPLATPFYRPVSPGDTC